MKTPRPRRSRNGKSRTVQITFRIPEEWLDRAARIVKERSRAGVEPNRTDALRMAMAAGFARLEK